MNVSEKYTTNEDIYCGWVNCILNILNMFIKMKMKLLIIFVLFVSIVQGQHCT